MKEYNGWKIGRKIGSGSFGNVYEIEKEDFGYQYKAALKIISIPNSKQDSFQLKNNADRGEGSLEAYYESVVSEIVKELELMYRLRGISNIVSYEDHEIRKHENGIGWDIMIRMELLTPLDVYKKNHPLSRKDIIQLGIDMCKAHIANVEETLTSIPQIEIPEFQVDVEPIVEILQDMQSQFAVLETAADQQEGVTQLLNSAQEFMDSVKESSSVLRNKSSELIAGLDFADSAIKNAQDYINTLRAATSEVSQGSAQLSDGAAQIDNGAKQLADGTEQYYTEGILTAADYARQATLKAFISRCKAYIYAAKQYNNITGIENVTEGSVRFTVRTEEIAAS